MIEGALRSAPREAVLLEAGLCTVRRVAESLWMCELEKCLRAPVDDPRRDWGSAVVRRRLVRRTDWRTAARRVWSEVVPNGVERDGWLLGSKPWSEWNGVEWHVEEAMKSEDVEADKKAAVLLLRSLGTVDLLLYTDGSAVEGVRRGGAAVVLTRGDPEDPVHVDERLYAAGMVASSFQAEVCALRGALVWLQEHAGEWERAVVVSDSQAALRALRGAVTGRVSGGLGRVVELGRELGLLGKRLVFVLAPGHRGLVGNEWADRAANEASLLPQSGVECMYKTVRALGRRRETVVFEHERSRRVYGEGMKWELEKDWVREDVVSLARFRSGHSLELGGYRRRIGLEGS